MGERREVIMPALGMNQDTGLVVAWRRAPGDPVAAADILLEVETDKATVEIPAEFDGFVAEIHAAAGTEVPIGTVIAVLTAELPELSQAPARGSAVKDSRTPPPDRAGAPPAPAPVPEPAATAEPTARILASPKARRAAREYGVDLADLVAAGVQQPIRFEDVADAARPSAAPSEAAGSAAVPVASPTTRKRAREPGIDLAQRAEQLGRGTVAEADLGAALRMEPPDAELWAVDHGEWGPVAADRIARIRRTAAARLMAANREIPTVTHHDEADVAELEKLRASMRSADRSAKAPTALAYHVAALAVVLKAHPRFNASLSADGGTLWLKNHIAIGIAVDAPHGLVVPVIRDADRKGIGEIAAEIAELARRSRDRTIRPDEMGGAGMTISNLGAAGGTGFTPIINPPEVAILGIARTATMPVWNGRAFEPRPLVALSLSYDHRVIDGADVVRFLADYKQQIAAPTRLAP